MLLGKTLNFGHGTIFVFDGSIMVMYIRLWMVMDQF